MCGQGNLGRRIGRNGEAPGEVVALLPPLAGCQAIRCLYACLGILETSISRRGEEYLLVGRRQGTYACDVLDEILVIDSLHGMVERGALQGTFLTAGADRQRLPACGGIGISDHIVETVLALLREETEGISGMTITTECLTNIAKSEDADVEPNSRAIASAVWLPKEWVLSQ